jgi:hypothetical protein
VSPAGKKLPPYPVPSDQVPNEYQISVSELVSLPLFKVLETLIQGRSTRSAVLVMSHENIYASRSRHSAIWAEVRCHGEENLQKKIEQSDIDAAVELSFHHCLTFV